MVLAKHLIFTIFAGQKKKLRSTVTSSSSNSKISSNQMRAILEGFLGMQTHRSTMNTYKKIWASFNLSILTSVLELKKIWDPSDSTLVEMNRITPQGLTYYWEAVDRTIQYCDTTTLKKQAATEFKEANSTFMKPQKPKMGYQQDRFHWR